MTAVPQDSDLPRHVIERAASAVIANMREVGAYLPFDQDFTNVIVDGRVDIVQIVRTVSAQLKRTPSLESVPSTDKEHADRIRDLADALAKAINTAQKAGLMVNVNIMKPNQAGQKFSDATPVVNVQRVAEL